MAGSDGTKLGDYAESLEEHIHRIILYCGGIAPGTRTYAALKDGIESLVQEHAAKAVAKEREECARVAEREAAETRHRVTWRQRCLIIALFIRSRSDVWEPQRSKP